MGWAATDWPTLDGAWLAAGVDFTKLPLDRQLNLLNHELFKNADQSRKHMLEMMLNAPLEGERIADVVDHGSMSFEEIEATADDNRPTRRRAR